MIAETFLDPFLHEFAPREMRERRFRQKFADACYEALDDNRLAEFLTAVRSDDVVAIAAIGKCLSATLRLHPDDFVSDAAGRMERRPESVFRYSERRESFPKNTHIPTSQYAAFYPGLQCVEAHLDRINATGTLLRDEDAQFGVPLDFAFARAREVDCLPWARDYGAVQLNRIQSCWSTSSGQELGIQVADLAAGLFGRVVQALVWADRAPFSTLRIVEAWRETLAPVGEHYVMVSDARLQHVTAAIFGADTIQRH